MATDRHGPHTDHGKDRVIFQASHVGYDPETETFGSYCRLQTPDNKKTTTCGKVGDVLRWYQDEHRFAQNNIYLSREDDVRTIAIDNQLLDERRAEGLFLDMNALVRVEDGKFKLQRTLSTSRAYIASDELCNLLPDTVWPAGERAAIGSHLDSKMFS